MGKITLRFVTSNDPLSGLIRLQAGICVPFTPSHVEALSLDGKSYLGQHVDGGMQARPIGYDAGEMAHEVFVALECDDLMQAGFYNYLNGKIGQPYDWRSILSFIDPAINLHDRNHLICSAIQTEGLRARGYFKWPLVVPFHHISPRDLLMILSAQVSVDR